MAGETTRYQQALEPENKDAMALLADCEAHSGDFAAAVELLGEAARLVRSHLASACSPSAGSFTRWQLRHLVNAVDHLAELSRDRPFEIIDVRNASFSWNCLPNTLDV